MTILFYLSAIVAVVATLSFVTALNAVHALLNLIVSFLAVALILFLLGAPFAAALEVIIYAGAIMVLFVFVVMMLDNGPESVEQERRWIVPRIWLGPALLAVILLAEVMFLIGTRTGESTNGSLPVGPKEVGAVLLGPYVLGVELASILLLPAILGAYHLGRRWRHEA